MKYSYFKWKLIHKAIYNKTNFFLSQMVKAVFWAAFTQAWRFPLTLFVHWWFLWSFGKIIFCVIYIINGSICSLQEEKIIDKIYKRSHLSSLSLIHVMIFVLMFSFLFVTPWIWGIHFWMHEHVNYSSYKNLPSLAKGDNSRCSLIEKSCGFSSKASEDDQTMHPSSKTFTHYQWHI